MKLTRKSEYGLKGLLYLARQKERRAVLTSEVSAAQDIPQSFLNKIFQKLVKAGILKSYRGYRGGFSLAKKPKEITLKKIVEILEGPIDLWPKKRNVESDEIEVAKGSSSAALLSVWQKVQLKVNRMLEKVTVLDLMKKSSKLEKSNDFFDQDN
ncbi:RrF2 family transcriptional regulator [Patescibacteria group bacterium]